MIIYLSLCSPSSPRASFLSTTTDGETREVPESLERSLADLASALERLKHGNLGLVVSYKLTTNARGLGLGPFFILAAGRRGGSVHWHLHVHVKYSVTASQVVMTVMPNPSRVCRTRVE